MKQKILNCNINDWICNLEDNSIGLTLTSPPYDDIRNYNGYSLDMPSLIAELYRVTKPGGYVIWNIADQTKNGSETCSSFKQALMFVEAGFRLHDTMIYVKRNPMPSSGKRYHQAFEYVFCFSKGKPEIFNPIMVPAKYGHLDCNQGYRGANGEKTYKKTKRNPFTKVRNVFEYSIGGGHTSSDPDAHQHPAIMHEQLAIDMITSWSNEGDLVFDPFCGSGTTGVACIQTNRSFLGVDVSDEYCELAYSRLKKLNPQYLTKETFLT